MRGNAHVRFGGRAGETDRPKGRHRAPVRPNHTGAVLAGQHGRHIGGIDGSLGALDAGGCHALPARQRRPGQGHRRGFVGTAYRERGRTSRTAARNSLVGAFRMPIIS